MNETNRGIVVGYDGSAEADLALRWAGRESSLSRLPVKVLVVDDLYAGPWSVSDGPSESDLAVRVERILEEAGVAGKLERVSGPIVPELLEAARDASMLVVGSHGHGRVSEAILGSVSQHAARHAFCPVAVVREPSASAEQRIVVGVDGSGGSTEALEFACSRAELTGETVAAVHAWKVGPVLLDRRGQMSDTLAQSLEEHQQLLSESVAGFRSKHPDLTFVEEAIPVAPGQALVDASATASLVVTGSRGRGAFKGMLLGSVSHEVLFRARCPVVVVR